MKLRCVFPHDDCVFDHSGHLGALRATGKSVSQPLTETRQYPPDWKRTSPTEDADHLAGTLYRSEHTTANPGTAVATLSDFGYPFQCYSDGRSIIPRVVIFSVTCDSPLFVTGPRQDHWHDLLHVGRERRYRHRLVIETWRAPMIISSFPLSRIYAIRMTSLP